MKPEPKITIVTPSFNQADYLSNSIRSVIGQGYGRIEYMMLDGGSTDATSTILEGHRSAFAYFRSHADGGQAAAINEGLAAATGHILCWVNSDDGLMPGALATVAGHLDTNQPAWLIGDALGRNSAGRVCSRRHAGTVDAGTFLRYKERWIPQPSVFWNRAMQARTGLLDASLDYVMDLDWFFRMYQIAKPIQIAQPLSYYTVHGQAKTSAMPEAVDREYAAWLARRVAGGDLPIDALLDDFVYLQRCHRTLSEHVVLSRLARFWKRVVNPRLYL